MQNVDDIKGEEVEDDMKAVAKNETHGSAHNRGRSSSSTSTSTSNMYRAHRSHDPRDQQVSLRPIDDAYGSHIHNCVESSANHSPRNNNIGFPTDNTFWEERGRGRSMSESRSPIGCGHSHIEYQQGRDRSLESERTGRDSNRNRDGNRDRSTRRDHSPGAESLEKAESGQDGWTGSGPGTRADCVGQVMSSIDTGMIGGFDALSKGAMACRYFNSWKGSHFGDSCQFGHFAAAFGAAFDAGPVPDPHSLNGHLESVANTTAEGIARTDGPQYSVALGLGQGPGGYVDTPIMDSAAGHNYGLRPLHDHQQFELAQNSFLPEGLPVHFFEQQQQQQQPGLH